MNNIIKICIICTLLSFLPSISTAQVSSEYMGDKKQTYSLAYPVVDIEDKKIEDKINEDIEAQLEDLKEKIEKHVYSKVDMTYYEKYEESTCSNSSSSYDSSNDANSSICRRRGDI